jgi:nicotinamidase-related amidase
MSASAPWLVAIDLQHVFADPASPWGAPRFADAAAAIERLAPAFGDRIVRTRWVAPHQARGAWADYFEQWPFAMQAPAHPMFELVAPFDALPGQIETRETFGKWDLGLAAAIGGAHEIVLVGVATDCCVLSTALAAADAGARVRIPVDGCAGGTDEDHERALAVMGLYAPLIELTTVDEVLAGLS